MYTGHISLQYHVTFDNLLLAVFSSRDTDIVVDAIFNQLFEDNFDWYADEKYKDDKLLYRLPQFRDFWFNESNRQQKKERIVQQHHQNE